MDNDIVLKTSLEIAHIRRACRVAEETLRHVGEKVCPGITTVELADDAEGFIRELDGVPALIGYRGFPAALCTSPNNVAAHGIPDDYPLQDGDVISIDVTVGLDGWHGDAAWTFVVGTRHPEVLRLVRAAWQASVAGVISVRAGGHIGDVGAAVVRTVERHNCSVVRDFVGHGIGRDMHEEPRIPNVGERGQGPRVVSGMVFTVEPIVSLGAGGVNVMDDGWTIATADNSLTAQFEHTVAVYRDGIEILTLSRERITDHLDEPPYF